MDANDITEFTMAYAKWIGAVAGSCVGFIMLRKYKSGGKCTCTTSLAGKTVIVTGASAGIGLETAKDLASRGAHVIMASRDLSRTEAAAAEVREVTKNNQVFAYRLNLASLASVREFAESIKDKEDRLDVLINNAGVFGCPKWISEDGYEVHFAVNHLGHFYLTNLLLDLLKKSAPSRVVNVSAVGHKHGKINFDDINSDNSYSRFGAYAQTKLANVLFTRELSDRLQGTGVTANSLHPGVVNTPIKRHVEKYIPESLRFLLYPFTLFMKTPAEGAQTSIYVAVSEDLEKVSGKYFSDCVQQEPSKASQDKDTAVRLWQLSEEMVNKAVKKQT